MQFEERLILKHLFVTENYFTKVQPFLTEDLFSSKIFKAVFSCVKLFQDKYNKQPSLPVLELFINNVKNITDEQHTDLVNFYSFCKEDEGFIDEQWLQDSTIEWIRKRSFEKAIMDGAISIDKGELDSSIATKLDAAMAITFDTEIGMEFTSAEDRWEKYTSEEEKIAFGINKLNTITNGGVTKGTLNILLSSDTGGYKTGTMVQIACDCIKNGLNVLYASFELSEDKILERVDANFLDTEIDDIVKIGKENYIQSIKSLASKHTGRLIAKQFPTSQCHVGHIRYCLNELRLKKQFVPDVIMADYIGIMASMRMKSSDVGNSYGYLKAISEELRGLAIEFGVPIWSGMQSNRGGAGNEDLDLTDISDSYATTFGADLVLGIVTTPEYDAQNKILFKQLKNRYRDKNKDNKFFLNVNKAKMTLYDPDVEDLTNTKDKENDNVFKNIINKRKGIINL